MKKLIVGVIPQFDQISESVKVIQSALNDRGYTLKVDGRFGPKTLEAVKELQKKSGLQGTGSVGAKTLEALEIEYIQTPIPVSQPVISSGQDPDEGTVPWYQRMFLGCEVKPGLEPMVASAVKSVESGFSRYLEVSTLLGFQSQQAELFAYILGALHYKEASCSFAGVLHNGEKIIGTGRKTTLVPAGRGPFETWESAAIDAINLNGGRWKNLRAGSAAIGDILFAMERFNGAGYITGKGKEDTTPYLWACSNVNDGRGLYVKDGVYDPNYSTTKSVGAAVILKQLYISNKFKCSVTP